MTNAETINRLATLLPTLSGWAASFAESVLEQSRCGRALSDKQMFHVNKIVAQAAQPAAAPQAEVGNVDAVVALFDKFAARKNNPSVVLILASHKDEATGKVVIDEEIRVSRYGAQSKYNGQIKVASHTHFEDGMYGPQGRWYGTITTDGKFGGSRKHTASAADIVRVMTEFCAAPAAVATRDGKLMGRCVFCYKELSQEDSAGVGYGKTCAKNHGMPYGKAATQAALAEDLGKEG